MSFFTNISHHCLNFFDAVVTQFLNKYIYHFTVLSIFELAVFFLGFAFIHLLIKENRFCWLIAAFNCSVLTFIWAKNGLIGQVLLYIFYVGNSIYAFIMWSKKDRNNQPVVKIKTVGWVQRIIHISGLVVLITFLVIMLRISNKFWGTNFQHHIKDMTILVFSIYALILQVRKHVESMFYYALIDSLVFVAHLSVGNYLLAVVRAYITIMSFYGLYNWLIKYRRSKLKEA